MRHAILWALLLAVPEFSFAQKLPYVIYNASGEAVSYEVMLDSLAQKEVVLFGELHNNPIAHWLQVELTRDLHENGEITLGAEMFEADNQLALSAYLADSITQEGLDTLARLWSNYETDYAPLVNFARTHDLNFVATNVPRRYASLVYRKGFEALDSLSAQEHAWMAPLPIQFDPELPQYQKILTDMGDHGTPGIVKAQALKDATMAHFILQSYVPGAQFIHYNGAYHSDFYEGILWYLKGARPELNCGTISTVSQADVHRLEDEHLGRADFIICVDEDMTTTY